MKAVFSHIMNTKNFGDLNCGPKRYFSEFDDSPEVDLSELKNYDESIPVILGGGGIFMSHTDDWIKKISEERPTIIWGAGLNYPKNVITPNLDDKLKNCKLVGLRDKEYVSRHGWDWVPCASCMDPAFDKYRDTKPEHKVVVYRHMWYEKFFTNLPTINNDATEFPDKNMDSVIKFLSSGDVVITNSFHGAYWTLLLGRVPIVIYPPGMRMISPLPPILNLTDEPSVQFVIDNFYEKYRYPNYLLECRYQTQQFYGKVKQLLGRDNT